MSHFVRVLDFHAGGLFYHWYRGIGDAPEDYYWFYLPIGMGLSAGISPSMSIGFNFDYRIMALGMMLPGMVSGALQEAIGYKNFFLWIMLSTIPGFVVATHVKIDPEFGRQIF